MQNEVEGSLPTLEQKREALQETLRGIGKLAIAFSGGVDSTLLLAAAHEALGDNVVAITARAQMIPAREIREATELCEQRGIRHVIIDADALAIPGFAENPADRCYVCKTALFTLIMQTAAQLGFDTVAEGTNTSDLGDYRPGLKALGELKVRSPLLESGLSKADVRALSRSMGLPTWDKPSYACLASRIPYGQLITGEALRAVEAAEDMLIDAEFAQVRCRAHGKLARIEVPPEKRVALMEALARTDLSQRIKQAGFDYVAVDADGYRSGSLNETIG